MPGDTFDVIVIGAGPAGENAATGDLGLDAVGLEPGKPVEVDERLQAKGVAGGWLYAVGDCNGLSLLTHIGKYQARIAGDVILVIVGATFTGPGTADLLHSATVAIAGEVTLDRLWHAVPSFPTVSEVWLRLLETYGL